MTNPSAPARSHVGAFTSAARQWLGAGVAPTNRTADGCGHGRGNRVLLKGGCVFLSIRRSVTDAADVLIEAPASPRSARTSRHRRR
jgi:hypothetical protein